MFENGYIERLIRQIGQLVTRAATPSVERPVTPEEIDAAWSELLGIPEGLLDVIDAPTLAKLLGQPEKQRAGADLLDADATIREPSDPAGAAWRRKLARDLRDRLDSL
jgi:hypothetical protein